MSHSLSDVSAGGQLVPGERAGGSAGDRLAQISSSLLRSAAERVIALWRAQVGEAIAPDLVVEDLVSLSCALASDSAEVWDQLASEPASPMRRRLLERLRAEILRAWQQAATPPDPATMLDWLSRLERLQEAMQPNWDHDFASRLMGPEGLDLVMEIAHDLRSPLTSILFLAETLQRGQSGDINEIQHRQLGIIYSAALGLTSLVSDVIELARGGNRLMDKEPSPFSVTEIFESVRDIVQPTVEEKGLVMRLRPPLVDQRLGYATALSRVLLNLTTNALNYTDEGFVELTAAERGERRIEFSVRDTGRGLKPEVLHDLYQPFKPSRIRGGYTLSSSGLGLAICRKLIEAMGSELQLETRADWGTRFFFALEVPPVH